jgi:hypothetical protein
LYDDFGFERAESLSLFLLEFLAVVRAAILSFRANYLTLLEFLAVFGASLIDFLALTLLANDFDPVA